MADQALTVLIVDDEVGALTLIGIMLERGGFAVVKASHPYQALDILNSQTPDVIILDVMMPDMDGVELCAAIRTRPEMATTPILILSARGDAQSIARGMEAGANDYLLKPILHHDLITKINKILDITEI